ncbi:MAG: 30S ribosome-binding factor RbfA [Chloroflexi bacterium]|jgi:ribosome-binding factor A|nr:30S ribosome-binding factor RbfA [Chloroflexota bacterium]
MSQRLDRVDELLRQEIGAILEREIADPRIGFVTVTRVETSPDLANARVWVSVIGSPDERTETMRALEKAMPYVRRLLGGRVRIRRMPALHVHRDESIERGARVLRLIDEIEAGTAGDPLGPDAAESPGESLPTPTRRRARAEDAPDADGEPAAPEAARGGRPRARTDARKRP